MKQGVAQAAARRGILLSWLCALGAASTFVPYLAETITSERVSWVAGLASHWQWAYSGLAVVGAVLALFGGRLFVLAPLAIVAAAGLHQSPSAAPMSGASAAQTGITVATANVNYENADHTALKLWLTSAAAPDVIALQEFTDTAKAAVASREVIAAYPYQVLEPSPDQFGLAVLSRHPIASVERVNPANPLATLKLRTVLEVRGRKVAFTGVHPMPPVSAEYARERDASLRIEAAHLVGAGVPGILLGDMNDTPWSTGLRGTVPMQRATTLAPTWPNAWGWASVLPLDHILVTPGLGVVESFRGPDLGSDHLPVVARLVLL